MADLLTKACLRASHHTREPLSLPDRLHTALSAHYRTERELGRGGMATVYLAHDARHDRARAPAVHGFHDVAPGGNRIVMTQSSDAHKQLVVTTNWVSMLRARPR